MDNLSFGWDFPIAVAFAALFLFFAGAIFITGIYTTILFLGNKFSGRAVTIFWLNVLMAILVARVDSLENGVILFGCVAPILAAVFWYYERKHRQLTEQPDIFRNPN